MIKGISFLQPAGGQRAYERLARLFAALGFERGRGWEETSAGDGSRGASFFAPLGNLEFVDGRMPPFSQIAIEVTSLDAAYQAAAAWLRSENLDPASSLTEIEETQWKSRYFTITL